MFFEWISNVFRDIWSMLTMISFFDVVDIACVAIVLYYVYKFIRDRRAGKLAIGVVFLLLVLILTEIFRMNTMQFIFQNIFQVGMIALIILFQPELRSALEKMGGESIKGLKSIGEQKDNASLQVITDVCEAVRDLSIDKTGALIVFERETKLGDLILTGTVINANVTPYLIRNIFFNKSPLHDGAVIVRDGRLYSAGCLLPLSSSTDVTKSLGTRHRAALGMSENSDAVVVVVSEETGIISVAFEGQLKRNFNYTTLKEELILRLGIDHASHRVRTKFRSGIRNHGAKQNGVKSENDKGGTK